MRRCSPTSLADRRGHRVAGDHTEEKVGCRPECLVEDDRTDSGGDADDDA